MNSVILNGKRYLLKFTVNSLCALEEYAQQPLHEFLHTDVASVRALLWCGMLDTDAALTLNGVGDMLEKHLSSGGSLELLSNDLADAIEDSGFFASARTEKQ